MSLYKEGIQMVLPSEDESIRRQAAQYFHYTYADQETLTFGQAIEALLILNKHLTDRLRAYEKANLDRIMLSVSPAYIMDDPLAKR